MTAAPDSPAARPDCTAVADEFAVRMKGLQLESLRVALQVLQARLGSELEQPCDVERVQVLGHEINNRLTVVKLETGLRQLGPRPGSSSP